ncbi:Hypothetical protein VIBNISFn27_550062 [Vibrio nigripulchritudo SFn27]|uniref:Uncharacterized protein n=1 Tax=Vibrio nigripulchritudo TaxID=28173 RepID=U4KFJ0_9VIBR|nr:hypothetical protein [Vibrio nigripulchritudo]CCN85495.1 Hypothetical protein VIBNIBLFn1_940033 [Vibrio nigripulchritudo BLFn1]CCN89036.1 Hypothetical protein VIBNISFn27_550062 [Vibrio nigripulchritudo SFn27]CCN95463.1 Hypothetical protein VIBNIENn2_570032 [Vibrio nigripulchritudo ENn2]CCO43221.1 Hypothetical protein VIBNISFn135_940034 [Vibrio nigripulchritudo SFn135]CCO54493.1 Hypothetical protein VIBNIWn13_70061 [Vibrio nigripulchritudo Wn13]
MGYKTDIIGNEIHEDESHVPKQKTRNGSVDKIDNHLTEIEKSIKTLSDVAKAGIGTWQGVAEENEKTKRQQLENENKAHKRTVIFAGAIIGTFAILMLCALFLGKDATAEKVLDTVIKLFAGAGFASFLWRTNAKKS